MHKLLNSPEDIRWLKDVHLKGVKTPAFASFAITGNEDAPDKLELYAQAEPSVTHEPVATFLAPKSAFGFPLKSSAFADDEGLTRIHLHPKDGLVLLATNGERYDVDDYLLVTYTDANGVSHADVMGVSGNSEFADGVTNLPCFIGVVQPWSLAHKALPPTSPSARTVVSASGAEYIVLKVVDSLHGYPVRCPMPEAVEPDAKTKALQVIVLTKETRAYLEEHDPKALQQAERAIES